MSALLCNKTWLFRLLSLARGTPVPGLRNFGKKSRQNFVEFRDISFWNCSLMVQQKNPKLHFDIRSDKSAAPRLSAENHSADRHFPDGTTCRHGHGPASFGQRRFRRRASTKRPSARRLSTRSRGASKSIDFSDLKPPPPRFFFPFFNLDFSLTSRRW